MRAGAAGGRLGDARHDSNGGVNASLERSVRRSEARGGALKQPGQINYVWARGQRGVWCPAALVEAPAPPRIPLSDPHLLGKSLFWSSRLNPFRPARAPNPMSGAPRCRAAAGRSAAKGQRAEVPSLLYLIEISISPQIDLTTARHRRRALHGVLVCPALVSALSSRKRASPVVG